MATHVTFDSETAGSAPTGWAQSAGNPWTVRAGATFSAPNGVGSASPANDQWAVYTGGPSAADSACQISQVANVSGTDWESLSLVLRANAGFTQGYLFLWDSGVGTVSIFSKSGTSYTELANVPGNQPGGGPTGAGSYNVRAEAQGTTLRVKIWDANSSEPGTWNLTTTDSTYSAAGYAGIRMSKSSLANLGASFADDFWVGTPGETFTSSPPSATEVLDTYTGGSSGTLISSRACDTGETPVKLTYSVNATRALTLTGGGRARVANVPALAPIHYVYGQPVADARVDVTVFMASTLGDSQVGVLARVQGSDGDSPTEYMFRYNENPGRYELYRAVAGSYTLLGTYTGTIAANATQTIGLDVSGSSPVVLVPYIGGVGQTPVSDSDPARIAGAGHPGVYAAGGTGSSDSAGLHVDRFSTTLPSVTPTAYTLTPPSPAQGRPGVASGNFTLQLDHAATADVTFTLSDGGAGVFSPASPVVTTGNTSVTFTYAAATAGVKTITATNDRGLTDPAGVTFTAYTLTLTPSSQSVPVSAAAALVADLTPNGAGLTAATGGSGTLSTTTPLDGVSFTLTKNAGGSETVTVTGPAGTSATATVVGTLTPVVSPSVSLIDQGGVVTLAANNFTGGAVTWQSSNPAVAAVDSSGVVVGQPHGLGSNQSAVITATGVADTDQTATATVVVRAVSVGVSPTSLSLAVGDTQTLVATVTGSTVTTKSWLSSDPTVATVNSGGQVAAVAVGTCNITVTADADTNRTAVCAVSVTGSVVRLLQANFGTARSGLATVGYTLFNPNRSVYQARTTSGVGELGTGSGIYTVAVGLPAGFSGFVEWDTGEASPKYAGQVI